MNLNDKIVKATKWSTITEIVAKLITPITNMILARILAPEAFGVIATVTMVISFADMFTDAGFQKYLVQHEFKNDQDKYRYANVAFGVNFIISVIFWVVISLFRHEIATLVGNPGLGNVIAVACVQLVFTSFSSIQMSLYKRDFDFKTIFGVRLFAICIPFITTIPLAIIGFGYWSLVIGSICTQLSNAIIMTVKSKWKPKLVYDIYILKDMLSFSIWSLIEAVSIWFTVWIDAFIIGAHLNQHYLGLYKTSTTMVNSLLTIITASVIPVLFSALSRLQRDDSAFQDMFYKVQRCVAYMVLPMGVGTYLYRELATQIFLGDQWSEASNIVGIWVLTSVLVIIYSNFNSEVYRAKGKPKLSFISQILHLTFLVPTCIISLKYGFWIFIYARSLIRLQGILVGFIIMQFIMKFSAVKIIENTIRPILCTLIMGGVGIVLQQVSNSIAWNVFSIGICILVYLGAVFVLGLEDIKFITESIKSKG